MQRIVLRERMSVVALRLRFPDTHTAKHCALEHTSAAQASSFVFLHTAVIPQQVLDRGEEEAAPGEVLLCCW